MKCPNDQITEMIKGSDFLDFCPHCGAEKFAVRRQINDLKRNHGGVFDFSKPFEDLLPQIGKGFEGLVFKAYTEYHNRLAKDKKEI